MSLFSFPSPIDKEVKKKSIMSHGTFDERGGGFFGVDFDGTNGQGGGNVLVRERHQSRSSFGDVNWTLSTLDESISKTFKRDVDRIASNVWNVLDAKRVFCFFWRTREEEENGESSTTQNNNAPLRDWDLYGPLLFVLLFGVCLATSSSSSSSSDAGTIFSVVFATVAFGGVALTLNVKFLGGKIVFLQAMSLIGYCIFPLDASAALCRASSNAVYRLVVVGVGVLWSAAASVPFVSAAVVEERKALAVYPMVLLYVTLGLFAAVVA